ncbi:DUF4116 domain-containing protein [Legionella feeleii]|uniref:DUF4116 domain-containing protein n=1 Tax=Legionella feeleii TaxID=453 RepID=A0A378KJI0_9GAMM|nr:DUF4116 domain-containing protein [Legionella feeleii]STX88377.1 Uncharacterised protein [Legionella feeleii]
MKIDLLSYIYEANPTEVLKLFNASAMRQVKINAKDTREIYFAVQRAIYLRQQELLYLKIQQDSYLTLQQDGNSAIFRMSYLTMHKDEYLAKQINDYSLNQESTYSETEETAFWSLLEDKDCILAALINNPHVLRLLPDHIKNDEKLILAVVQHNGLALQYASEGMRRNEQVVRAALINNAMALKFVLDPLTNKIDIVLLAVQQNGLALQYTPKFNANKEVVMAALAQDAGAFEFINDALKNDQDLIALAELGSFPILNILLPLKEKLRTEDDPEVAGIMQKMIYSMEKSIIAVGHDKDIANFVEKFNGAILEAQPKLERQKGWQGIVDYLARFVIDTVKSTLNKLLAKKEESLREDISDDKIRSSFSFFSNPNPVKNELEQFQKGIKNLQEQPSLFYEGGIV